MAVDIKAVKAEILEATLDKKPPASVVADNDLMDQMLKEYFNPASNTPREYAVTAITAGASIAAQGADISEKKVQSILDKYKP